MRNLNKYAMVSAVLLSGAVGLAGCSSDEEITQGGADLVNGEAVKTQFSINIPYAGKPGTRMAEDIVQGQASGAVFRGMTNIRLVPFVNVETPPLKGSETMRYNAIVLGDISALEATSNAKIYNDVDIPVGTNAFLFYGEATPKSGDTSPKTNGALVPSFLENGLSEGTSINTVTFSLQGILGENRTKVDEAETYLAGVMNGIAGVSGWNTFSDEVKSYYDNFITMKAGSANSILKAVEALYNAMDASSSVADANNLKSAIQTKIQEYFTASGTYPSITLKYTDNTYETFPGNVGLPDGSVQLAWSEGSFKYVENVDYNDDLNVASLADYVYPSSLYYWANSAVGAADNELLETNKNSEWSAITALYSATAVSATTRSVILKDKVNYAVARLDVKAVFNEGEVKDNKEHIVTLPSEGFELKGVLVGGQKDVEWNFATDADAKERTVYDASVDAKVTRASGKNVAARTLVLETEGADNEKVNFALEFVNNSNEAFQGKDGIVPVGSKFYLVGQLEGNADGTNKKVFAQDKYTTATVTINSLKNAYNCVPDLRAPGLELGLSVDLEWQEGLADDVTIE